MRTGAGTERAGYVPDVPGKVLTPAENHPAVAVAATLERFCGGGAIALVDAGGRGGRGGGRGRGLWDEGLGDGGGSHVGRGVGGVGCGLGDVEEDVVVVGGWGRRERGWLAVHWPRRGRVVQPKRCLSPLN